SPSTPPLRAGWRSRCSTISGKPTRNARHWRRRSRAWPLEHRQGVACGGNLGGNSSASIPKQVIVSRAWPGRSIPPASTFNRSSGNRRRSATPCYKEVFSCPLSSGPTGADDVRQASSTCVALGEIVAFPFEHLRRNEKLPREEARN